MAIQHEQIKVVRRGAATGPCIEVENGDRAILGAMAVSVAEFCRLTSLGRTTAFSLIRDKRVETRRIGGRTLILTRSIEALLDLDRREPHT